MSREPKSQAGPSSENATALEDVAARWVARLDRGALSESEQAELDAWTGQSARHAGAFARAAAADAYLDRAAALGPAYNPDTRNHVISRRRWIIGAGGLLAASLVVAASVNLALSPQEFSVPKGGVHRTLLADGSAVTLNSGSTLQVRLKPELRSLHLVTGEAIFDVAKDAERPFVVEASGVRVQAVGTSFIVRVVPNGDVVVTMREGVVRVDAGSGGSLQLVTGQQATLRAGRQPVLRRLAATDLRREELWKDGMLDLTGMTLGEAADQFGRYSDRRIVIEDPNIAGRKVAGLFPTNDPESFARAAAMSLGLRVSVAAGSIEIHAR